MLNKMPPPVSPARLSAPARADARPRWRDVPCKGLTRLEHPLWQCAFRPFFALAAVSAPALLLPWLLFLLPGWPLPAVPGGPLVWHAHELLLGLGLAATAGFALTAVPEFTDTPSMPAGPVRWLVALWLAGRLAFWGSGWLAPLWWLSGALHAGLLLGLIGLLWPRLWRQPGRRHLSFVWALAALLLAVLGLYVQGGRGGPLMPWLHGLLGAYMALIVVAMSRISMSIVNTSLETLDVRDDEGQRLHYLARPPRRNMAVLCIALCSLAQLLQWPASTSGWLALAAAAAVLNLLNDWHVGRALLRPWPLALYGVYVFMAAGYALLGLSGLGLLPLPPGAGWHLLAAGSFGLNILLVLLIAGHTHSGLNKDGRPWVPVAVAAVALGALLRTAAYGWAFSWLLPAAGLLWAAGFTLLAWHMLPMWLTPRGDGASGCAGVQGQDGG